jgi:hypothetical protein
LLECKEVEQSGGELRFKVGGLPKNASKGDKCFIVHNGYIRGYHYVSEIGYRDSFTCNTTGKTWKNGNYIIRSGKFHKINPILMKGFQGFKYVDIKGNRYNNSDLLNINLEG